jgi:hypothetical protein
MVHHSNSLPFPLERPRIVKYILDTLYISAITTYEVIRICVVTDSIPPL